MPKKHNYDNAPQLLRDFIIYLQLVKNRSELTVLNYYTDLRSFLRFYKIKLGRASSDPNEFSKIDITDITEAEIKAVDLMLVQEFLIFEKTEKSNEHKARYRKAVALRQFFKFLTNNKGLFEVNPMTNLELPSPKPALPKYLTLEQSLEMLTNIDTPDQKRDYCIVVFFLNCGMRLSELVGINISDIRATHDANGNEIYSLKVLGKGSKERIVYLNNACVNAYMDYIDPSVTDEETRQKNG
ncbi:MAG: tyrosine-type recombinase/integrase, partial [Oscillospiraceae bacterium]|nr:tyrosine-type recombinase/integrase [Oscillospiraceae bacterium]